MERIDKYEVLAMVGRGGMGVVYKAFHPHLKKYVAIKEVGAQGGQNAEARGRFEQEAQILAQLPAHPNLVMVRDALIWNERLYLVMDFIEGQDLGRRLQQGPIPFPSAVTWLGQIMSGLEAIHRRGIIHRDLKPGNILIDGEDNAYISDFGIAETAGNKLQPSGMATVKYAAPELIDPGLGRGGSKPQADIYAAGMLAYEMLLGAERFQRVFAGIYSAGPGSAGQRWLAWHTDLAQPAPSLHQIDPQIPSPLAAVVARMMAKDVKERYCEVADARRDLKQSTLTLREQNRPMKPISMNADDVTVRLDQLRSSQPNPAGPAPPADKKPRRAAGSSWAKRLPKWAWPAAAALVILSVILFPFLLYQHPGVELVVKGAPPGSQIYVDDVPRGIPGIEQDGKNVVGLIRVHGLKGDVHHAVRLRSDCGNATLYDEKKSSVEQVSAQDGAVVKLTAMPCESPAALTEIDYRGKMRLVRGGPFWMGNDDGAENEKPARLVTALSYDYYMDKFEVSNKRYSEFCPDCARPSDPWWSPNYSSNYPDHPVVGVSWNEAKSYCEKVGKGLPTEAEWEKAASWTPDATDDSRKWKRRWPWGEPFDASRVNLGSRHTTPAEQYEKGASAYGVYNLAANASEWVADAYNAYPGSQFRDPDFGGGKRVVRGGSFRSDGEVWLRTTSRVAEPPTPSQEAKIKRSWLIGFRCAVPASNAALQEHLKRTGQMK